MLTLTAAYLSWLRPLVPVDRLIEALKRTIQLLDSLSALSPVFRKHTDVLRHALRAVEEERLNSVNGIMHYDGRRTRGHSGSGASGTPRYNLDMASATSSFGQ